MRAFACQALPLYEALGAAPGIAQALRLRGNVLGLTGHTEQALRQLERALPLLVELGDQSQQASTLRSLGELQMQWAATLDKRCEATASAHHRQQAVTDRKSVV